MTRGTHAGRFETTRRGLTLIELLVATAIMALLAAGVTTFVSTALHTHDQALGQGQLCLEGQQLIDRLTDCIRRATYVAIPNAHAPVRDILALSGFKNDDKDSYFGDPLFPRIDEDLPRDINDDGSPGLRGIDDDGDGYIDEGGDGHKEDDDEDGFEDEDPVDGIDNDGDGNIDEDPHEDANRDGRPGLRGIDDDGDGWIDDDGDGKRDDDEDGSRNEDPMNALAFGVRHGTSDLLEFSADTGLQTLSERVAFFRATFAGTNQFVIELKLTNSAGQAAWFREAACARNILQRTGKRVR